jgi:phasin family protein
MNLNETFDLMSKSTNQSLTNLRKLAEINLNTWDQLVATQMAVMSQCFEATSKQAELMKSVKPVDEMIGQQSELARDLGEKLVEHNKEVVEILSKTSNEYQALAEASVEQARSQLDDVAEVAKQAAA